MFLQPQHFQAADRHAREAWRRSEDWFHPFDWGFRALDLDREAVANATASVRSCEARFKDGTKLSVPDDAAVDPVELKGPLSAAAGEVTVYLAVPTVQGGRANVEPHPTADGPRYWIDTQDFEDENTGGHEQPIQFRRTRARLLLSGQDQTGYEVLPMAKVVRSSQAGAPPQVDTAYVPPLLALDAWMPLWRAVQSLHHQIGARVEQMAAQLLDRGISFESLVPGDAERMLKLSALNAAFSYLEAVGYVRGMTPLSTYRELCRLVGQLAIFSEARRPPNLPGYDHEDLGGCFHAVIKYVQLGLDTIAPSAFEKRYFERAGERLQVSMEPDWLTNVRSLFLGVETELSEQECQEVLDAMDMKVGSGAQVENYFRRRLKGLKLTPVARPPRALPAGAGTVYFQIERDQVFWTDVADTHTLGVRMNLTHATFQGDRKLSVALPKRNRDATFQFALYVI
jgi:type VI secretion system protein ImpJ